jgi:CRP-like cAMP-binding protein
VPHSALLIACGRWYRVRYRVPCLIVINRAHNAVAPRFSQRTSTVMDQQHVTLLRIHDACRGLSSAEIALIAEKADVVHAGAGQLLHTAGETIDAIYIVVSGRLKMLAKNQSGGQRTVRYISAGDQFGALMLFSDEDIPVDIVVDEKSVLFRLGKDAAAQLMEQFPILRRNLLRKIGFAVHDSMHWRRKRIISKIVTFFHTDDQSRRLVSDIASQLDRIGEQIGIIGDHSVDPPDNPNIEFKSLLNQAGQHLDQGDVRALIEELPDLDRNAYRLFRIPELHSCLQTRHGSDTGAI